MESKNKLQVSFQLTTQLIDHNKACYRKKKKVFISVKSLSLHRNFYPMY